MNDPDSDLRAFFQAERERDLRDLPPFPTAPATGAASVPTGSRSRGPRMRLLKATLLGAAAAALAAVIPLTRQGLGSDGDRRPGEAGHTIVSTASPIDLDELCDAALAALDEHEAEVLMMTPTDALLSVGQ